MQDVVMNNILAQGQSDPPPSVGPIPEVLLKKILEKLSIRELARLRLVSKSWNRILTQIDITAAPWLIDPLIDYCSFITHISFVLFPTEARKRYRFKIPKLYGGVHGGWFCGSSRGWLLFAAGPDSDPYHVFLWNPLLGLTTRKLPVLSTLPFVDGLSGSGNISRYIKRVEVFPVGSEECVVAAAVFSNFGDGEKDHLAFCTPQEKTWSLFECDCSYLYEDILFHKGKLYALSKKHEEYEDDGEDDDEEEEYTIQLSNCAIKLRVRILNLDNFKPDDDVTNPKHNEEGELHAQIFDFVSRCRFVGHLVESSTKGNDELLVVSAILDSYKYNSLIVDGDDENLECEQTGSFEIRSVQGSKLISTIGEQAIYVGSGTGSVSVPSEVQIPERIYANHIFFSTDDARAQEGCFGREVGAFSEREPDLSLSNYMRILPAGHYPKIGWFTPKLFSTCN